MSTAELPSKVRLGPESAGVLMTPEEFDAVTDFVESFNYELIHGVVVVTPMSSRSERSPNELLGIWLYMYQQQHPAGQCLVDTLYEDYVQTRSNRRRADRVIWVARGGHRPEPSRDIPTVVVEFVSAGKAAFHRDLVEKRDEYLDAGVAEYWVVDRFRRLLTVFALEKGAAAERQVRENEVYRPALLPGFELPLKELLLAADKWEAANQPPRD
jgi:Uma2 family endonuclease